MSLISDIEGVIFGKDNINIVGLSSVDLWLSETHEIKIKKSNNPIESGASITDNAHVEPSKLTLSGYVSNLKNITPDIPFIVGSLGYTSSQKVKTAWTIIKNMAKSREPLQIVTNLDVYNNMMITSVKTAPINRENGTSLEFTLELEDTDIVDSATTTLPPIKLQGEKNPSKNMTTKVKGGKRNSSTNTKVPIRSLADYII